MSLALAPMLAAAVAGALLVFLACVGWWITHAEVGVDPFAGLPEWTDDTDRELDDLLAGGA